jgi:hypothetical protein
MLAIVATGESRRVPVLLGGSGLASRPPIAHRMLPMLLLRPLPGSSMRTGRTSSERHPSGLMTIDLHLRRIAATVVRLVRDDPSLVKEVIARQRAAGAIAPDDLVYLDRIADHWIAVAEANAQRGTSAPALEPRG